jgi:glycosyltransferase involved in cell wall biosynthesis
VKLVSILTPCFRGERYLEGYFEAVLAQTVLDSVEVVLVHNEPSPEERSIVDRVMAEHPGLVRHIVVPDGWSCDRVSERGSRSIENVSRSMNLGVAAAEGRYIALWNVDDIRVADSIEAQVRTLEEHPDALMTYGDMVMVPRYGDTSGELIVSPGFDRETFMRGCFGGFQMWRSDAFAITGPFDEQLRSGADFDLWVRFAANGTLVRTPQVLGYYLNAGTGLSTARDGLQPTERTVIEMRYGMLDKIDRRYLGKAGSYRVSELLADGEWIPVARFVPDLDARLERAAADPRLEPQRRASDRVAGLPGRVVRAARSIVDQGGKDR